MEDLKRSEAFNLDDVLKQCFWAAKEYRDNPADDYIIEKIIGFVDSNNLFSSKYSKLSDKLPGKFIDKDGRNRYDLLLKSYLELEKRLSRVSPAALEKLDAIDGKALGEAIDAITKDGAREVLNDTGSRVGVSVSALEKVLQAARAVAEIKGEE